MANNSKKQTANLEELISLLAETYLLSEDSPQRLRDIFLQPTKDLIQTAAYSTEKLSASIQKTIKGLSLLIPTLIIPGLEFRYDLFAKDEQEKLDAIKKKYGEALARNWEAIKDPDVFGFLLLAYPESMLGFAALKKSPLAFLRVLEVVTGGLEPVRVMRQNLESTAAYTPRQTHYNDPNARNFGAAGSYVGDYFGDYGGTGLTEAPSITPNNQTFISSENPELIGQIQVLLQNPLVQQAISNSQLFKDMKAQAVAIFVDPVKNIMAVKNFDDFKNFINPDNVQEVKNSILNSADYQKMSEQDKNKTVEMIIGQVKNTYKKEYIKWLTKLVNQHPETSEEVKVAINSIKNMS